MTRFDILIPAIPHRHERLCALLEHLDRQMQPGAAAIIYRDNLEASYGDKSQALLEASRADYVAFLDDDDWVAPFGDDPAAPSYISSVLAALEEDPDYVGFPERYTVDGRDQPLIVHSLEDRGPAYAGCQRTDIVHKNPLRRELALLGRWEGGWGADSVWGAQVRASGRVRAEVFIGEPMYHYNFWTGDEFRTHREPFPGPLPPVPGYGWLTQTGPR